MKRIGTTTCAFCGRVVMVTKDGLLQRHQIKASRRQVACSGSGTLALRTVPRDTGCQVRGCDKPAVVEISGYALKKPGWWRACSTHRRVFAAQRPLTPPPLLDAGGTV